MMDFLSGTNGDNYDVGPGHGFYGYRRICRIAGAAPLREGTVTQCPAFVLTYR